MTLTILWSKWYYKPSMDPSTNTSSTPSTKLALTPSLRSSTNCLQYHHWVQTFEPSALPSIDPSNCPSSEPLCTVILWSLSRPNNLIRIQQHNHPQINLQHRPQYHQQNLPQHHFQDQVLASAVGDNALESNIQTIYDTSDRSKYLTLIWAKHYEPTSTPSSDPYTMS